MTQIAAIFDLDDTILTDSTGRLLWRYLRKKRLLGRYFRWRGISALTINITRYRLRLVDATRAMQGVAHLAAGIPVDEFWELIDEWFHEVVIHTISPKAEEQLDWHRRQGHILAICSGGSQFSVLPVARHLDIEHTIYTDWYSEGGQLTGEVRTPIAYGAGKVHWMEKWSAEQGVDLTKSYFYSDHISDCPLLERVAHPTVVNPNKKFAQHAKEQGWPVLYWA